MGVVELVKVHSIIIILMSFKERFNGKTTIVGKQGILGAINTLSNSSSPFDTSINHFNKPAVYQLLTNIEGTRGPT